MLSRDDYQLFKDFQADLRQVRFTSDRMEERLLEIEERWTFAWEQNDGLAEENARLRDRVLELETAQSSGTGSHRKECNQAIDRKPTQRKVKSKKCAQHLDVPAGMTIL